MSDYRIWAYAIEMESGNLDVNANRYHTREQAEAAMKAHNLLFPDDRRCIVSRPLPEPWTKATGQPIDRGAIWPQQAGAPE